jgi:predicted enzyme related to lactoylglutathione lyase
LRATSGSNIAGIEILVDDLERAEAFYTAVLGLGVRARENHDDFQEVIVCGEGDAASVCLVNRSACGDAGRTDERAKILLKTDDVPARYDAAIAAGGAAVDPPKHFEGPDWSLWFATVRDPDGHRVQLLGRHALDPQ